MTYLLDYSARRLSGAIIKSAGYGGAIRYVGGTDTKHVNVTEYKSIVASKLTFLAVMEDSTGDADGGRAAGIAKAQRAKAHCDQLGYHGVIFFCNDTPTLPSSTAWEDYLTGAASVLGWERVGAYGFANAMDVARNLTPCRYFWLAGSNKWIQARPYLNYWQDNNTQVTVSGITCDRNLILKPVEDDMALTLTVDDLNDIATAVHNRTVVDPNTNKALQARYVWADAARYSAQIGAVDDKLDALTAKVDKLQVSGGSVTIDYAALAKAVNDDAAQRMQS